MRFIWVLFRTLLLAILCVWLASPPCCCMSGSNNDVLCLSGDNQPRVRRRNESFSNRAVADAAQARAYLSPAVFTGTLKSVLVQRDGTVRAWFTVDSSLKMPTDNATGTTTGERGTRASRMANYYNNHNYARNRYAREYYVVPAVRPREYYPGRANWTVPGLMSAPFRRRTRTTRPADTEVVYYRSGKCVLEVNQDNLRLGSQYVVFGVPVRRHSWPSLAATALPIANDKRILRAVKKVLCNGCAKPPSIEGLQNVVVEEGSRARLQCHLAGNPIPWVEWLKDGKKITKRGRIRVKTKRRTSRLVIRRSRLSDRGVYECRAGNVVQKEGVSARASLVVTKRKRRKTTTPAPTPTQSSPWTTEPCPMTNFCNNGGTCVFYKDVREFVCHCAEGFVGLTCDYKDVRVTVGERKNYSSRGAIP